MRKKQLFRLFGKHTFHQTAVRAVWYFGTMRKHGVLTTLFPSGEFSTSALCLRTKSSPPYFRLPAARPWRRVLRQQLTLLGSPSVLRLCAYAQSPHHLIPVYPPSVRDGKYFGFMLMHEVLTVGTWPKV